MPFESILYHVSDGIAAITFNRPEKMNAITPTMLRELNEAFGRAESDPAAGVIILTGSGRAFSAGVDLKALGDRPLDHGGVGGVLDDPARELIERIQTIPKAVIAKINGFCFTGALEIALSCDLIYVADDAKLGDTHAKWGLRPTWGMSQRLPRHIGVLKAKELSFTADTFTGRAAEAMGMVNRAVAAERLDVTVESVAKRILANSAESVAAYKELYNAGMATTLREGLELERSREFDISDTESRLAEFRKGVGGRRGDRAGA